ncbi:hypothetical protein GWI33_007765 [Rhynchophorus ferrugineus]|uniref:Partner of Y14 and mago n=1 Tax=Rhynchophorus ferrugineus TaxID=354439 RepID=A0A834IY19_RHYFE|nr:hypothetical protein GWI33_007765 [Rhynchophorus ferrugineus]
MSTYAANIVTENGEQFIPASQRPDGTWRKARRVKEGYVPQEEVPLYESKGKVAQRTIPGLYIIEDDKEKKGQKKKPKNKIEEINKILESTKISEKSKKQKETEKVPTKSQPQETIDPAKKLKNLKKRLREVEALEEKVKSGALAKPEPDQLAKINRKNDLLVQIRELEKQVQ